MDIPNLLGELCAVSAPSGAEGELADPPADVALGAALGRRSAGTPSETSSRASAAPVRACSVQAHMDQVGYLVRHVTDEGFLLLDGSQGDRRMGPERRHPVGQPVRVLPRDGLARGPDRRRQRPRADRRAARRSQARLRRLLGRARHPRPAGPPRPGVHVGRPWCSPADARASASCSWARPWTTGWASRSWTS